MVLNFKEWNFIEGKGARDRRYSHTYNKTYRGKEGTKWHKDPIEVNSTKYSIDALSPSTQCRVTLEERNLGFWWEGIRIHSINLEEDHIYIYNDPVFGGIVWSEDETHIAFIGEQNYTHRAQFAHYDHPAHFSKYEYTEDFGEFLRGKSYPTLYVCNIYTGNLREIILEDIYPQTPVFVGEDIVINGLKREEYRYGLFGAFNRPSSLYLVEGAINNSDKVPATTQVKKLTEEYQTLAPYYDKESRRIYYFATEENPYQHNTCMLLKYINKHGRVDQIAKCIIPEIPRVLKVEGGEFAGIYGNQSTLCAGKTLAIGGKYFIFNSLIRNYQKIFGVNTETGEMRQLNPPKCSMENMDVEILDCRGGLVVCKASNLSTPPRYYAVELKLGGEGDLDQDEDEELEEEWSKIEGNDKMNNNLIEYYVIGGSNAEGTGEGCLWSPRAHYKYKYKYKDIDTPDTPETRCPLIVYIHGGPHSVFPSSYNEDYAFLLQKGYAILSVNYRGSTSYGRQFSDYLKGGNLWESDVEDTYSLCKECLDLHSERIDPNNVFLYGYSHGGFIGGKLLSDSRYQGMFSAGILQNPAIAPHTLLNGGSDLIDLFYAERYAVNTSWPVDPRLLAHLEKVTPMLCPQALDNSPPTLLILGANDVRVPNAGGLMLYHALKAKGRHTNAIMLPQDPHWITTPEGRFHNLITTYLWCQKYYI